METRTIAYRTRWPSIAAFAAAFGIGQVRRLEEDRHGGRRHEGREIKVAAPAAVAGVEVGGTLPALKAAAEEARQEEGVEEDHGVDALDDEHGDPVDDDQQDPVDDEHDAFDDRHRRRRRPSRSPDAQAEPDPGRPAAARTASATGVS